MRNTLNGTGSAHKFKRGSARTYNDSLTRRDDKSFRMVSIDIREIRQKIRHALHEFFTGKKQLGKLIALKETNFKYSDIKVRSKVRGSSRTLDLAQLNRLRSYYDVTDEVVLDKTGHPEFESIDSLARELSKKLKKNMGLDED
jgi:hypothetical protein